MRDKEARERILVLKDRIFELENNLGEIVLHNCPKCGRITIQRKGWEYCDWAHHIHDDYAYQCLVCGTEIPFDTSKPRPCPKMSSGEKFAEIMSKR